MKTEKLKKQIAINMDKHERVSVKLKLVADKLKKIERTIADQEKQLLELELEKNA